MVYLFICLPTKTDAYFQSVVGGQNFRQMSKPTQAHLCLICVLNVPMQKWARHCKSFIPQRFYCIYRDDEFACVPALPDGSSEAGTTHCRRWPSYSSFGADNSPSQTYCCSRRHPQTEGHTGKAQKHK